MTQTELRRNAAQLAREIRAIPHSVGWGVRGWNQQVRIAIRNYMKNVTSFIRANKEQNYDHQKA